MDEAHIAQLLGSRVVARRPVTGGNTPAERWIVKLADDRTAFVKVATDDLTAVWLRKEIRVYSELQAPFMPELLGWADERGRPMLILEDLSDSSWPPPWEPEWVVTALGALAQLSALPLPSWLSPSPDLAWIGDGWQRVGKDPGPLLATGIVSAGWLDRALPVLFEAGPPSVAEGNRLCHFDIRSDNLSFRPDGSAVIIDWNFLEIGNPRLDLAFWLPSLALEGGPMPEKILPDAAAEAAVVAGYFASRCGLPPIPDAPHLREFQARQLLVALPWACRALGLPPP